MSLPRRRAVVILRPLAPLALAAAFVVVACSSDATPSSSGAPAPSSPATAAPEEGGTTEVPGPITAYTEAEVQKLFNLRCVKCHDVGSSNVDLSPPFTKDTVGVPVGGVSGKTICGRASELKVRIQAGDREASLLWHKVKRTPDCGSPMPYDKGNKPLDATELERLGLYIDGLAK